ncbi:MAG: methylmalonyl Co-A mutase-associated GTPase MeaB [Candidatus Dormibacteria bacterium]
MGRVEIESLLQGDIRSLARAISMIESRQPGVGDLLEQIWQRRPGSAERSSQVVGVTGPPGSGKSTMADALTQLWRDQGRRVAVLAVDPNSPFTGGAILGDRVRMQRHALDQGVFIRSMGARGHLGGVSLATRGAVRLLDALGWEMVLVETVGVGQSELEICEVADSVVVVTTPGAGDGVQVIKAGITEIADIFAVNKADLPGVDRVSRDLRDMLRLSIPKRGWKIPVVPTVAAQGVEGVSDLASAIAAHRLHLEASGELSERLRRRFLEEVVELVTARAHAFASSVLAEGGPEMLPDDARRADPERAAEMVLERFHKQGRGSEVEAPQLSAATGRS